MSRLRPRRVVITGASDGIGAALARHYGAAGATLGLIARRRERLEQLGAQLSVACECYAVDVRDGPALADAARHFMMRHGSPDVVIANAGVSVGTLTEVAADTQVFREVMDINVIGLLNTFQPFIAPMRKAGCGALVGIASVAGYRGLPGSAAYSASKAAVIAYLESLRVELRTSGVEVITICPGYVATAMTAGNTYPMPFLMSAEEAAAKIAALIARGRPFSVIPWQMALVARALHLLPRWLYDRLFVNAPRKPRRDGAPPASA
jgi:short-subunit dehydrogenase